MLPGAADSGLTRSHITSSWCNGRVSRPSWSRCVCGEKGQQDGTLFNPLSGFSPDSSIRSYSCGSGVKARSGCLILLSPSVTNKPGGC